MVATINVSAKGARGFFKIASQELINKADFHTEGDHSCAREHLGDRISLADMGVERNNSNVLIFQYFSFSFLAHSAIPLSLLTVA
ncbi:hypothetical protein BV375_00720 [Nostoc sp. 106C]|nr:hypothetical protein BV375_00720 [Nostoc sp. 106C]